MVLLDEFYKGTDADKAAPLLTKLAEKLANYKDRVKVIFISHCKAFVQNSNIEATHYTTHKVLYEFLENN